MNDKIELLIAEPLSLMMRNCERFCVVYCCGIYAFDPTMESVGPWVADAGREKAQLAQSQVNALIEQAKASNPEIDLAFILRIEHLSGDQWMSAKWAESMDWLNDWKSALNEALDETKEKVTHQ